MEEPSKKESEKGALKMDSVAFRFFSSRIYFVGL